ncbi:MAG: hypothetical protein GY802_12015, partial [Gammaproteobacteria bacterium]|nr:hypothetical protein [Gammaproteobacteria bacterium]
ATIDTIETADTITQVVLTLANVEAGDTLSFGATNIDLNTNGATVAGGFTYTVSSAGATPVVTISHAGATDTAVNTMLDSAVFNNTTNNDPSTTARTVTFSSVTDSGSGTIADGTVATVNVVAVNDAPTFSAAGDGILTTGFGSGDDSGQSVTVQSDGKILVAGHSHNGTDLDFSLTRYNTDGTLDTSFGTGGIVTTAIGSGDDRGNSVTVQSDGKILVAGYSWNGADNDFALARYNADGSLDTSFDGDGILTTDFGANSDVGQSVTVQSDGKILVAGYSYNGSNIDFALARYNTDGSLDTGFDTDGRLTTAIGASHDYGNHVMLQTDGKILVAGYSNNSGNDFALARYNSDGSLDVSFDGDGKLTTDIGGGTDYGRSLTVQSDGKILLAGYSYNGSDWDFALTRYNADGSYDSSFDGDGVLTTDFGASNEVGQSVTVQSDGKILVAGYSNNGGDNDFALTRYNTDGSLDSSFDGDGKLTTAIGSSADFGYSVTVQNDGKILLAGNSSNGVDTDFALVRYNTDGSLDTSFALETTLDGTPTFIEGGAAVVLDVDVDVSDSELDALNGGLGNYNGASLTLVRNGGASSEDVFSETGTLSALTESGNVVVGGTIIGTVTTNSGGTLLLTFNTNATTALVNSALQQIAYSNSSDVPPASAQIDWSFDDGNSGSQGAGGALQAVGSTTVTITAVNDTPTFAATAADDTLTENTDTTSAAVFSTVTIDPIETGDDIASAQLTIAGGIENTDTLTINGTAITGLGSDSSGAITGGHSYSYTQATGVVTIT